MRPYPAKSEGILSREEAVFNYRLSRARMVVENAFGILAQRWRILSRKIPLSTKNVDKVVKASCVLHNYLCHDKDIDVNQINMQLNPRRESIFQKMLWFVYTCPGCMATDLQQMHKELQTYLEDILTAHKGHLHGNITEITYREE